MKHIIFQELKSKSEKIVELQQKMVNMLYFIRIIYLLVNEIKLCHCLLFEKNGQNSIKINL